MTASRLGPINTPRSIKVILTFTAFFNLLLAIIPQKYLMFLFGLSKAGIEEGFIWQVITNLFIIQNPAISFSFILHLLFNLSIIWIIGSSLIESKGLIHFISLLSLSALSSSLAALGLLFAFSSSTLFFGGSIIIYSLATAWLMLHKDAHILLFFSIPFKGKWLILGLMAINLLSLISNEAYICLLSNLSAAFISYLFSLVIWKVHSPFSFLKKAELAIIGLVHKVSGKSGYKTFKSSKIYDFKTGKPIADDDEFMDTMLTRISLYGEEVISKSERKRMDKISRKRVKGPR